jgi:thiol-disulfide isomerase/thioredoxin
MRLLVRVLNYWSYPVFSIIFLGVVSFLLAGNGVQFVDMIVLAILVIALFVVWQLLHTTQTGEASTLQQFEQMLKTGQHATVVEFFSSYCMACIAAKPIVDGFEAEAGEHVQIIRLNIDQEPGKTLVEEYGVVFTPTFVYFDADGNRLRESVGVLDKARFLYELERL